MAAIGKRRRLLWAVAWMFVALAIAYTALLALIWSNRVGLSVSSAALSEARFVTIYGGHGGGDALAIYSLDGERLRNGLILAANATIISALKGQSPPAIVAVHSGSQRDRDFRPRFVSPASWRPNISGRAAAFDTFLIEEVRSIIERRFGTPKTRWLFGHSLAGFYALDMPSRREAHGFHSIAAFSPTFSHDLSLISRLDNVCSSTPGIYVNIGIESGRDTNVFEQAAEAFAENYSCRDNVILSRHHGIIHQLIMMTGQGQALLGRRHLKDG